MKNKSLICLLTVLLCLSLYASAALAVSYTAFSDTFNSSLTNWVTGGWLPYAGYAEVYYQDYECVMTQKNGVNVSGTVTLKFDRTMGGASTGKYLKAEVYNGSSWIQVYDSGNTSVNWATLTLDISSYANADLKVQFKGKAPSSYIFVDNVYILTDTPPALPGAFELSAPSNGETGVSLTPALSWTASAGATSYDVYYGETLPSAPVANVTGTNYTIPTALANSTTYQWKVAARNAGGETTATGAPQSFTTEQVFTTVFSDTFNSSLTNWVTGGWSPYAGYAEVYYQDYECVMTQKNGVNVSETVKLKFDRTLGGASSSKYLKADVYDGSSWTQIYESGSASVNWATITLDISSYANTDLKVRFRGKAPSSYISVDNVYILTDTPPALPGVFELSAPTNGATGVSVTPTLSWTASNGATSYDVYYGTAAPGTLQDNVTGTSYTVPAVLANDTDYYWKVVAKNALGETTAAGAPQSFTTAVPTAWGNGYYKILAKHSGKAMVVYNSGMADGVKVEQRTYSGGYNQQWSLVDAGDGYYKIVNRNSGKVLQVKNAGTAPITYMDQGTYVNGDHQKWQLVDLGDGYYKMVAKHSGLVAHVDGSFTYEGANIFQYTWQNVNCQKWQLVSVYVPAPAPFDMLTPANGATGVSVTPTLSWAESVGAESYDVYYGTTSPGTLQANVTELNYAITAPLANDTAYYWQIVAKNAGGETLSTQGPRSFTTAPVLPGTFDLTVPANGATSVGLNPTLTWTAAVGAESYEVYYGETLPGTAVANVTGTSFEITTVLANNTTYQWKVVAKNAAGEITATGAPYSFTTVAALPGAFLMTGPTDGAAVGSLTPFLTWALSEDADTYDIYYGETMPATPVVNVTGLEHAAIPIGGGEPTTASYWIQTELVNNTTYVWKIVAKNDLGETVATNAPLSFTTAMLPPGAFDLTGPANGATGVSTLPRLTWSFAGGNVDNYEVYMGTSSPDTLIATVSGIPAFDRTTGQSFTYAFYNVTSPLANDTTYHWKVVAKNAGGETLAGNAPYSFATVGLLPGAFELSAPANGATNVSRKPTLTWTASDRAESYDVLITNALGFSKLENVTGTSYTLTTNLDYSTGYSWNVTAKNAAGNTMATGGDFGFTTKAYVPMNAEVDVTAVMYYDLAGNITKTEKNIDGTSYVVENTYDALDRITATTYPDASVVYYSYNANNGGIANVGATPGGNEYLKAIAYDDYGLVSSKTLGNNVTMNYSYNTDNFRLTNVSADNAASQNVQNLGYTYNASGMVTSIVDSKNNTNWTYEYDDMWRLTNAKRGSGTTPGNSDIYDKSYSYNNIGNITSFEGRTYSYNDAAHKHAVTNDGINTYTYDQNGNMISGAGRTYNWNTDNKPTVIAKDGVETGFGYDANGNRVKKATDENWKIYVDGIFETDQAGNRICYINVEGVSIKKKTDGSLFFILKDHLGGTSTITDGTGNVVTQQFYQPYGLDDPTGSFENELDDHKFTGQEEDTETGLYNYGARLYDPALGRFISPDPVTGLNKYAYCLNNPVNAIDPTGNLTELYELYDGSYLILDHETGGEFTFPSLQLAAEFWGQWQVDLGIWTQDRFDFYMSHPDTFGTVLLAFYADLTPACQEALKEEFTTAMTDIYMKYQKDMEYVLEVNDVAAPLGLTLFMGIIAGPPGAAAAGEMTAGRAALNEAYHSVWTRINTFLTGVCAFLGDYYNNHDVDKATKTMLRSMGWTHIIGSIGAGVSNLNNVKNWWTAGGVKDKLIIGVGVFGSAKVIRDVFVNGVPPEESFITQAVNGVVGFLFMSAMGGPSKAAGDMMNMYGATWCNIVALYQYVYNSSFYKDFVLNSLPSESTDPQNETYHNYYSLGY
jgi:RHS repeat-associated protein